MLPCEALDGRLDRELVGAHIFAWVAADTTFFRPDVQKALADLAREGAAVSFGSATLAGILCRWLIAMMVWMNAASDVSRIPIIVTLTYVVGLAGVHVAGSVEILYLVMIGERSWWAYFAMYMLPTLIGNSIGGVALVSALNRTTPRLCPALKGRKCKLEFGAVCLE